MKHLDGHEWLYIQYIAGLAMDGPGKPKVQNISKVCARAVTTSKPVVFRLRIRRKDVVPLC